MLSAAKHDRVVLSVWMTHIMGHPHPYCVVMRPILFPWDSVNHRLPSGPVVMPKGPLRATGNSVTRPAVVMRPILSTLNSVNQRLPSGPTVMPSGRLLGVGMRNSVTLPLVVRRPMMLGPAVNHRLPSGPAVMPKGSPLPVGTLNSVIVPAAAQAGALLRLSRPTQATIAVRSAVKCDRHSVRFILLLPLGSVVYSATHGCHASVFSSLQRDHAKAACCVRKASPGRLPSSCLSALR